VFIDVYPEKNLRSGQRTSDPLEVRGMSPSTTASLRDSGKCCDGGSTMGGFSNSDSTNVNPTIPSGNLT